MGGKIAAIFVVLIVLSIGLYIYNSGVIGRGVDYLNSLAARTTSTPPAYAHPSSGSTGAGAAGTPPPSFSLGPSTAASTTGDRSPYYGQVRFGSVYAGSGGSFGQISLYAYFTNESTTADVTGWLIKSNRGGLYIPQAVPIYEPLGLAPETDIILHYGDTLDLYSSSAPVNLRLNECIGYLPNRNQFIPQLPQTCPYFSDRAAIQSFTGACQNYILSLGSCQLPDLSSPQIPTNDYACRQYIQSHFRYSSCFEEHYADYNFLSNQIWAWTGSTPLDPFHDTVTLYDKNGLVVDTYSY